MEKKLILFYDMDNTLLEMSKFVSGKYSGRVKNYYEPDPEKQKLVLQELHKKGKFLEFTPIKGSQSTINKLSKIGYTINIISQPMINPYCVPEKNISLRKYFPVIKLENVTYTFNKFFLSGKNRVLIDDNIEHLTKWEKMGGIAVCFERGYNKNWQGLKIKKHSDIYKILEKLEN